MKHLNYLIQLPTTQNIHQVLYAETGVYLALTFLCLGTRYIPPHLRKREETEQETEAQMKLKRQLKGLLNRCVVIQLQIRHKSMCILEQIE